MIKHDETPVMNHVSLIRLVLLVVLSLLAAFSSRSSLAGANQTSDPSLEKLVRYLEMEGAVKRLDRDIQVYRWSSTDWLLENGYEDALTRPDHPIYAESAAKLANRFWEEKALHTDDKAGPGLYLATDPLISFSYGGDLPNKRWSLTTMAIPKGTALLDVVRENFNFNPKLLNGTGCEVPLLSMVFSLENADCRKLRHKLMRELGKRSRVVGIAYDYDAVAFPNCPKRPTFAFVLYDTARGIKPGSLFGFSFETPVTPAKSSKPLPDQESALAIQALFESIRELAARIGAPDLYSEEAYPGFPWPVLQEKASRQIKSASGSKLFSNWMKAHILGCGQGPLDTSNRQSGE